LYEKYINKQYKNTSSIKIIYSYNMSDYKNIITTISNSVKTTNLKSVGMYSGSFFMTFISLQFLKFSFHHLPNVVFYFLLSYLSIRVYETMNDNSVNDKLNNIVFVCSYDVIALYSKAQIICKKIMENRNVKVIKEKIDCFANYEKNIQKTMYKILNIPEKPTNKYMFDYIKNGDVINKTVSLNKDLVSESSYDFIILSNESTKHKKIIQKDDVNSLNDAIEVDLDSIDMVPSTVKFMVFQLSIPYLKKHDEVLVDLQLSTSNYNFLIDGNIIDKQFLLYFVNTYYSHEIIKLEHLDGCELRFIDGAVNMVDMNLDEQYIHLYENTYEIKNVDTSKNLDPVNNFIESDEEYEITNEYVTRTSTEQLSDSSRTETNSD